MTRLHLAHDLTLPLDAVTQKLAWLGVTGSGKTYGASKLAELLYHAGGQFVAIDPVGVWYGLRLDRGGKKPSAITVPVFGGLHGDVPLEATAGALLANLIVDRGLSAIVDVSQFESDAEKARFAADFADRLFQRRKAVPAAMHLFLEECQEFVPQNPQRGEERMLHVFTRMQKLGRNYGIGSSYISQRPQEVNKKALNMAQTLFVFRTTGTHERKAIESWVHDKALDQDIAGDLPKIKTGHCHVWSPEFLQISQQVHILEKETFNASATPEVGAAAVTRELAPIDLVKIRADMAATIEKAKADDPRELKKQIAELKKQLAQPAPQANPNNEPIRQPKPGLTDADRALATKLIDTINRNGQELFDAGAVASVKIEAAFEKVIAMATREACVSVEARIYELQRLIDSKGFQKILDKLSQIHPTMTMTPVHTPHASRVAPGLAPATSTRPARVVSADGARLGRAETAILTAAVQRRPGSSSRAQLSVLSGYSIKSSSFSNAIGKLRSLGLIVGTGDDNRATDSGLSALGDFEPLPTGDALVRRWMDQLGKAEATLLRVFVQHYPHDVDKDTASIESGYSVTSSSFSNALGKLRTLELIKGLRASEELFS